MITFARRGGLILAWRVHIVSRRPGSERLVFSSLSLVPYLRPAFGPGAFFVSPGMSETDADLRRILTETRTIAVVGWSPNPLRPSHGVAAYLARKGYRVVPVNPGQAGVVTAWGEVVRGSLAEIGEPVDMVDIFRNPDAVPPVVDAALMMTGLRTIWMQLGVVSETAAAKARAAGVTVVMNRCPAIEIPRLGL